MIVRNDTTDIHFHELPSVKNFLNLTNQRYSRLLVLGYAGKPDGRNTAWFCECDCGTVKIVRGADMRFGKVSSCGCIKREMVVKKNKARGPKKLAKHPLYNVFRDAKRRCEDPKNKGYQYYGARGIKFLFESIEQLDKELGPKPGKGYTMDRIDVNGNYEPGNVRWANANTQAGNKRVNVYLTHNGETKCIGAWARHFGIHYQTFYNRYKKGLSVAECAKHATKVKCL